VAGFVAEADDALALGIFHAGSRLGAAGIHGIEPFIVAAIHGAVA
jgi:hypothetical protein